MPDPLVSVVVAVYQGEPFLESALESIAAQTYGAVETVVVDDGSTDRSGAIADAFAAARPGSAQVFHQPNRGRAHSRNVGIGAARGELITFLDADDLMLPGRIATQVEHLVAHPDCDLVLGGEEQFLEPGVDVPRLLFRYRVPEGRTPMCLMSMMGRAEVFPRVGPFDPTFRVGEDNDWLVRAAAAGVRWEFLELPLTRRRIHGGNSIYHYDEIIHEQFRSIQQVMARRRAARGTP